MLYAGKLEVLRVWKNRWSVKYHRFIVDESVSDKRKRRNLEEKSRFKAIRFTCLKGATRHGGNKPLPIFINRRKPRAFARMHTRANNNIRAHKEDSTLGARMPPFPSLFFPSEDQRDASSAVSVLVLINKRRF